MDSNNKYRQYVKNQYPEQYRLWLELEQDNKAALELPKDDIILRLEALAFRRGAVSAMSDTHYFCTPCDKTGEYNLVYQKSDDIYNKFGKLSLRYEKGVDVWKSCGRILKEGFYNLIEFDLLLDKMERSYWYWGKKDTKTRLPVLSMQQRKIYDDLPLVFSWAEGKEIAANSYMSIRTAQRFFGNNTFFQKVKKGAYMKKIIFNKM